MKRLLVGIGVIVAILIIAVVVFLATFDLNRYRPLVLQLLQGELGKPVRLERIGLGWQGGLALQLKGLTIEADEQGTTEPLLQLESASAVVKLWPLLRKQVHVTSVVLSRPVVSVVRDATGAINWMGLAALGAPAAASGESTAVGSTPIAFEISSVRVDDGTIHWTDAMTQPATEIPIEQVDVQLRNVSLTTPIDVEIQAALFSAMPNIHVRGQVRAPHGEQPGVLEDVQVAIDFSRLDATTLTQAVPALQSAGLKSMAGRLAVSLERLPLTPDALQQLQARLALQEGRVELAALASPIEHVNAEAIAQPERIEVKQLTAAIAEGTVTLTGVIEGLPSQPHRRVTIGAEALNLHALLPSRGPKEPQLHGKLSASMNATASGLTWEPIRQTLSGTGTVKLVEGRLANLNVLREVFAKLSLIPGLAEKLQTELPPSYAERFKATDTVFEPIETAVTIQNGALIMDRARVVTDSFELDGAVRISLEGTVAGRPMLRIDPELSRLLVDRVHEFQGLLDANGRMEFPVILDSPLARPAPRPDLEYIAARLLTTKVQDVLGDFLQKALEKQGTPAGQSTP